jgi:integrase
MAKQRDNDGIYKRGDSPYWWVSYVDENGKRIRKSTGTASQKEAKALLAKWRIEAHRIKRWGDCPIRTFDELMLRYIKATEKIKRDPTRDRCSLKHLYPVFSGQDLNRFTQVDVRRYVSARKEAGAAASTINKEVGLLSAAMNYARREWGWQLPNITSGCRQKEPEGIVRWITREEADALVKAASRDSRADHLADFIVLALHTGCRMGELLHLEWSRVDLHKKMFLLEAIHTKTAKRRSVPLNLSAYAAILGRARFRAEHCPNTPWVFCHPDGKRLQSLKGAFATACKRAQIKHFRIHDLRHTCAAWLVTAGVPLAEVRDLLGHKSVQQTERYAHLAPENVRSAVSKLDESRSGHVEVLDKNAKSLI